MKKTPAIRRLFHVFVYIDVNRAGAALGRDDLEASLRRNSTTHGINVWSSHTAQAVYEKSTCQLTLWRTLPWRKSITLSTTMFSETFRASIVFAAMWGVSITFGK